MHWGIENNLHWCLDVNFNEDKCRCRVDNSGENLAVIRHISLNLYKSFTSVKISLKSKRFRCSFDDDFLCSVILNKLSGSFHAVALDVYQLLFIFCTQKAFLSIIKECFYSTAIILISESSLAKLYQVN